MIFSLALEIARALVMGATLVFLWRVGRREGLEREAGWREILWGFGLLLVGAITDISDHFPELEWMVIFGMTPQQAFLEKVVGYLGGFIVLAIGLYRWLPHISARREVEEQLQRAHQELEERVRRGSAELSLRELDLEREIRQRQKATSDLVQSRALLETILSKAPIGLIATDEVGVVTLAKGDALRSLGFEVDTLVGQSIFESRPNLRENLEAALAGEKINSKLELDGRVFEYQHSPWFDDFGWPQGDPGRVRGVVSVVIDITEIERTQDQLRRSKNRAEEANRAKTRFLANMSHELRTPLNSVIGFANVLGKNKKNNLTTQDLRFIERIRDNGHHLLSLINEILDLSRIESGRLEVERQPVDIGRLGEEILTQMRGDQRFGDEVETRCEIRPGELVLETDALRLRQVLLNLVGNALKFTEHGEVVLRLAHKANGEPEAIEVVDTGIGIDAKSLERIFEAFQQVDTSTSRTHGGAGLGLSISRSLCRLLGYGLGVESKLGLGSTFRILLHGEASFKANAEAIERARVHESGDITAEIREMVSASRAESQAAPPVGAVDLAGKRVLVIDDSDDSRWLMRTALEDIGCEVLVAANGEEGFWIAHREKPDLITLDLMMPQMDGWEVLASLKRDSSLAAIPVVVVSAVADEHRGALLGAMEALSKPVTRQQLETVLSRLLLPSKASILVVDDEESERLMLAALLEDIGFRVETASDGIKALGQLAVAIPDLMLIDLVMPEMGGTALIHALRAEPAYRELPVVVVTGKELTYEERTDLETYVTAILAKGKTLEEELQQLLMSLDEEGSEIHG